MGKELAPVGQQLRQAVPAHVWLRLFGAQLIAEEAGAGPAARGGLLHPVVVGGRHLAPEGAGRAPGRVEEVVARAVAAVPFAWCLRLRGNGYRQMATVFAVSTAGQLGRRRGGRAEAALGNAGVRAAAGGQRLASRLHVVGRPQGRRRGGGRGACAVLRAVIVGGEGAAGVEDAEEAAGGHATQLHHRQGGAGEAHDDAGDLRPCADAKMGDSLALGLVVGRGAAQQPQEGRTVGLLEVDLHRRLPEDRAKGSEGQHAQEGAGGRRRRQIVAIEQGPARRHAH
mmetsp:Transcript_3693/g.13031  ORF Transcript_3693/g.13031 Transcript_3693/m.13031 type:complete len:283 (-) Transcript_3693:811-1659(-)